MTKIIFDIVADLINAEKVDRYISTTSPSGKKLELLEQERTRFFSGITRRVREISFLLADRDDKKEQILSEIRVEHPDASTIDLLSALISLEEDEYWSDELKSVRAISSHKLYNN